MTDLGVEYPQNETPELIEECERDIILIREYARMHKLDTKQRIAFEVICCDFMLNCIERTSSNYGLGINNFSGKKRCKKSKEITIKRFRFKLKRKYSEIDQRVKNERW